MKADCTEGPLVGPFSVGKKGVKKGLDAHSKNALSQSAFKVRPDFRLLQIGRGLFLWSHAMTSRVALCNEALAVLGDKSIVDLEEQTPQARACAVNYGPALRAVLSVHPWGCATRRAVLPVVAGLDGATAWRRLPDDLRLLSPLEGVTLEGRLIVADKSQTKKPLAVRYISSDVEPVDLPAPVSDAVVAALAVRLCEKLTGSKNKQADVIQLYEIRLRAAVRFDSAQAAPAPVTAETWLEARL